MITIKNSPEQQELMKAIGDKRNAVSMPAQEAYAAAIGPVIQKVLSQLGTASIIYTDFPFGENDNMSIPLDLFYDQVGGYLQTWHAPSVIGHLPTSEIAGFGEMKFTTYELESAVSVPKKYARSQSALNVLTRATERMVNELLNKQELIAWSVIMKALGEATTTVNGTNVDHFIQAGTAGVFKLDDLNRLITLSRRNQVAYNGTTPVQSYSEGITDLFVSPEVKEDIRAFAYNPMNTTATPNTDESTALGLPDRVREELYRSAGTSSLWDINITDLVEFGVSSNYNTLFGAYAPASIAPGGGNFSAASNEIVLGIDVRKKEFIRPIATDGDISSSISVSVDSQWPERAQKVGWYSTLKEGRSCVFSKSVVSIVL